MATSFLTILIVTGLILLFGTGLSLILGLGWARVIIDLLLGMSSPDYHDSQSSFPGKKGKWRLLGLFLVILSIVLFKFLL